MSELYQALGFTTNPFSRVSAEQELDYLDSIFVEPRYFNVLESDIKSGTSKFIIGDRGSGKSALMYSLRDKLSRENVFCTLIDQFYDVGISNNKITFLKLITTNVATDLCLALLMNKRKAKRLSSEDKQTLSNLVYAFYRYLSKEELVNRIDILTGFKKWNIFKQIFNRVVNRTLNSLISGTIEATSDFITKSLALPKMEPTGFYKEYIPELKLKTIEAYSKLKLDELTESSYLSILKKIAKISKGCSFVNTIVFLDKIDEFQLLKGKISNISEFIHEIAADTSLLQIDGIGLVLVIWSKTKKPLSSFGVRFDKFRPVDVNWIDSDIISILEKRIGHFSNGKKEPRDIYSQVSLENIIKLANKSPRDLLTICGFIYDEQSILDINARQMSDQAVNSGIKNFVIK